MRISHPKFLSVRAEVITIYTWKTSSVNGDFDSTNSLSNKYSQVENFSTSLENWIKCSYIVIVNRSKNEILKVSEIWKCSIFQCFFVTVRTILLQKWKANERKITLGFPEMRK